MNADVFVGGAQTNCCKQKESNNLTMFEVNSISLYLRRRFLARFVALFLTEYLGALVCL